MAGPQQTRSAYRYFAAADVDGFPLVEGEAAVYCPRQGKKVPVSEHCGCDHFQAYEEAEFLGVIAVKCRYGAGEGG
jgi:hypothetical protein